jgi:hypothetical protein
LLFSFSILLLTLPRQCKKRITLDTNPYDPNPDVPGWESTPLYDSSSDSNRTFNCYYPKFNSSPFPAVHPLPTTKLAASYCHDRSIHVFYQAGDDSILELVSDSAKSWSCGKKENDVVSRVVVKPGEAKAGSPLAVVAGGWSELRVFYVNKEDLLKEAYSDDHTKWMESESSMLFFPLNFNPNSFTLLLNCRCMYLLRIP